MSKRRIFISHSADETRLAKCMERLVTGLFQDAAQVLVSCDLKIGTDWALQLEHWLKDKPLGIVLASPRALTRPWVLFEVGAVWASGGCVMPVCCCGMTVRALPDPLSRFQAVALNRAGLHRLVEGVATHCGVTCPRGSVDGALSQAFGHFFS